MNIRTFIITAIDFAASAVWVIVVARIILSWIPNARNSLTEFVWDITEPLLKPFRRFNPKSFPLDLSPFILLLIIELLRILIFQFI